MVAVCNLIYQQMYRNFNYFKYHLPYTINFTYHRFNLLPNKLRLFSHLPQRSVASGVQLNIWQCLWSIRRHLSQISAAQCACNTPPASRVFPNARSSNCCLISWQKCAFCVNSIWKTPRLWSANKKKNYEKQTTENEKMAKIIFSIKIN